MARGSYQHEKALVDYLAELSSQGWKTINLKGLSPDGIAMKDNQIVAVEILIKGKDGKHSARNKRDAYFMFDNVFVKTIERDSDFEKKRIEQENNMFKRLMSEKETEKINKKWDKYGF
jgi:hypothetical protein